MCSEYRKEVLKSIDKNQSNFENKITYISAGVLTLSITLIGKFIDIKNASYIGILIVSWIFTALSLLLNLASYLIAVYNNQKTVDEIDDELEEEKFRRNIIIRLRLMGKINWMTLIFLVLGTLFIFLFIIINSKN